MLSDLTTLRLGGPAGKTLAPSSGAELVDAVRSADAARERVLVVAGGSNLVVGDDGWSGTVVLVRNQGVAVRVDGDDVLVTAQAGAVWDDLVARSVDEGWSGLATMSGIPGSAGATPVQNVGAYGSEVSELIDSLTVLDRATGIVARWAPPQCGFGFRTSAFKHTDQYVIVDVTFRLHTRTAATAVRYLELATRLGVEQGDIAPSARVREVVLELRRSKGMVLDAADHDTWSVGSFFVNPFVAPDEVPEGCPHWAVDGRTKLSAAWLIENAGFAKGFGLDRGRGTVSVSTKHSLALTNRGGATAAELLELAAVIRAGVDDRFGVRLRPEAHLAGVEF